MSEEITDNHIDIGHEQTVPAEWNVYSEVKCDCGEWVEFVLGGAEVSQTCSCGETWQLRAVKVDE